ncbi:NXPE family member 1-like [Phyllobates terribilis]|uniref:NXPE family member 1-like n=1 Tax=Phyllobates terribilis TaxID=111132 RepID=UPI003CCB06B4
MSTAAIQPVSDIQKKTDKILLQIDQTIPRINIIDKSNTTSSKNSKVYLKNQKDSYCVGDHLTVQVDMFDYLGKKKTYGGDFLRARISTPELEAGSSGRIEDFNNGTYLVHFILFWEGKVHIDVLLMHPSEGATALWTNRNKWHGYVDHSGKYIRPQGQSEVECGFHLDKNQELCEYKDTRDEEYFYCVKSENFSCDSLSEVRSQWRKDRTLLTTTEKSLFVKSNVAVEISRNFYGIKVSRCSIGNASIKERCKIGMKLEYPSGYAMKNVWYPKGCSMIAYESLEELDTCLRGKFIHIFGDSTLKQWYYYIESKIKTLSLMNVYEEGWAQKHLGVDIERNIQVIWKRHGRPFVYLAFVSLREECSIPREIDLIGGNEHTVIALNIGVHFRLFPVHHYIRRLLNIRRAIERLFLRSPETKVIIKTENTSDMENEYEGMSDFHAYIHYFIMEIIFKDLNVGFVNGWDMTTAFNTNQLHPPEPYLSNEVDMLMTYICS